MIAQADIISMQSIDQIKVAPHEPITAIHRRAASSQNAGPGIKRAARGQAVALQGFGSHTERTKWNLVIAVALVEPPGFVEQTTLGLQSPIEWCAREGREMIERGDVQRMALRERYCLAKTFRRVAVVTKNKRAIDANLMAAQVCQRLLEAAAHCIKGFIHFFEVGRIQAF